MSTPSLGTIAEESVGWSIALSVLMILTGVLAIMIPPVAGIAVLVVVAWLLMFSGAAHLVFAWHTRTAGGMVWELLLGILYILVGVYALLNPVAGLASLTLVLAIYLFMEALLELILSFIPKSPRLKMSWPGCIASCVPEQWAFDQTYMLLCIWLCSDEAQSFHV